MSKLRKGLQNPRAGAEYIWARILWWLWRRHRVADIYDREWDVAIILDACRYDLFTSVEWNRPEAVEPIYSVASMTGDWMERTFPTDASDTIYVTSAPFSDQVLESNQFAELDEVWRYGFNEEMGTIPPECVTDRAIIHGRESNTEQLVIHYMQPHYPFVPSDTKFDKDHLASIESGEDDATGENVWAQKFTGELDQSRSELWDVYNANLEYVLKHVEDLLTEIPGKTVITSDHGNYVGERASPIPIREYGHPRGMYDEVVVTVPWLEYENGERREITTTSKENSTTDLDSEVVADRLRDLGYRE